MNEEQMYLEDMVPDLKAIEEARYIERMTYIEDIKKARELGMTLQAYREHEYGPRFNELDYPAELLENGIY